MALRSERFFLSHSPGEKRERYITSHSIREGKSVMACNSSPPKAKTLDFFFHCLKLTLTKAQKKKVLFCRLSARSSKHLPAASRKAKKYQEE